MKEMIRMVFVLSLICGASGLTLASLRDVTEPYVVEQELTYVQGPALSQIFRDIDNNPVRDRKRIETGDGDDVLVFPAKKNGQLTGVAFQSIGKGFGGDLGIMVGFKVGGDNGAELAGIGVTTMKETPGVGSRITEPDFREQFRHHPLEGLALKATGGNIDAVSGATVSSTGTVGAVNQAIKVYHKIKDRIPAAFGS
ncbi:RnfABCDGE type electron transport complex subunit G [Desulfovibrio oxyclinae]|jgi:electron transport complex protein RnfG|uniref:RnfABCDGE type electron transport complex subunit G n=1 Tax=Desulfovibrio oxyclinae TaxID=63560 RepID=UPI0003801247|nr:FMN-binding protein [Desulfovibrio oxyclinae]